jgi:hypothetical protein
MPIQIVVPDHDPLTGQLERCAIKRGVAREASPAVRKKLVRKTLPKLARTLLSERLMQLQEHGDPLAVTRSDSN